MTCCSGKLQVMSPIADIPKIFVKARFVFLEPLLEQLAGCHPGGGPLHAKEIDNNDENTRQGNKRDALASLIAPRGIEPLF